MHGNDVRDSASIRSAVQKTVDGLGSLDIMVCNAGLNVRTPALDMTEAERDVYRCRAMTRARERYDWEAVTSSYESLLKGLRK